MRTGIIADIHSNMQALRTVLEALERLGVDCTVCAGDIVGYGAHPNECCAEMRRHEVRSIAGNHDKAALARAIHGLNPYAAAAAVWTGDNLNDDSRTFLSEMPIKLEVDLGGGRSMAVHHGSDLDPNEYVYEEDVDPGVLDRCSCEIVVLGHTHVPFVVDLPSGKVVNPGSVGQPRDGDPRASFAILDTKSERCEIRRVEYDIGVEAGAILDAGLPAVLAKRLSIGR